MSESGKPNITVRMQCWFDDRIRHLPRENNHGYGNRLLGCYQSVRFIKYSLPTRVGPHAPDRRACHANIMARRLEDTITFHLIERVQFPLNKGIYEPGAVHLPDPKLSLLDWMLRETERFHSLVRRYESPDEYPFSPDVLQKPLLQPLKYPEILHPNDININEQIMQDYLDKILPMSCRDFGREDRGEQEENYGSAATCDVLCVQALSRRIHFGKFVAESKFRAETDRFVALIRAGDRKGIDAAITNAAQEAKVLERLKLKAKTYGTDPSVPQEGQEKINVNAVVAMYKVSVGNDMKRSKLMSLRKRSYL